MERRNVDEYVDMSPRNAGYVEMRPGEPPVSTPTPTPAPPTPDGYVEMNYGPRGHPATRYRGINSEIINIDKKKWFQNSSIPVPYEKNKITHT